MLTNFQRRHITDFDISNILQFLNIFRAEEMFIKTNMKLFNPSNLMSVYLYVGLLDRLNMQNGTAFEHTSVTAT
jgi:hypothetical protein